MSLQSNTYVMCGAIRPYAEFKDRYDELEPYMDNAFEGIHHHEGACVLFDGMDCKYVIIGRVFAKSGNGCGFDAPITVEAPDDKAAIQSVVSRLVGTDVPVGMVVVTHYR